MHPSIQRFACLVGLCLLAVLALSSGALHADDWPQWLGPRRDGVWREKGILKSFPAEGPRVRWRTPLGGGYAGPAVAEGKVVVTDRTLGTGERNPDNPFAQKPIKGTERILCLDEASGKILWKHEYPCRYEIQYPVGPRTTPVIAGGKVFALGAMGDLFCLELASGKVLWAKNFPKDYEAPVQVWGFASSPLLDGNKLICLVGGRGSAVVAFDKDTGKELWRSMTAPIGYCPPMIYEVGGKRQLIIWDADAINGLDPETGKRLWSQRFLVKAALSIPTPRLEGDRLFITSFYNGSIMLKLDAEKPATVLWKGKGRGERPDQTSDLHAIMCTPVFKGEYIYGVCSYGELRCIKAADGERVWMSLKATGSQTEPIERWANAFIVAHEDRYFLFNEKGDLIIAKLSPKGYDEVSRAHLIEPTGMVQGRKMLWSHPAFANKCVYVRNDKEIICVSLEEK